MVIAMTTFIGCNYHESDSECLICPNCEEELVVARSANLMTAYDDDFDGDDLTKVYFICPICCVQNTAKSFYDAVLIEDE